jgi:hypothetical protein
MWSNNVPIWFISKELLNIKCLFRFSPHFSSEAFLIRRLTERDMIKMYIEFHVKYPLLLSDFNETWILSTYIRKTQKSNFMKICLVSAQLFHADRRTEMTKLIVVFRNFKNASNNFQSLLKDQQESLKTVLQIEPYKTWKILECTNLNSCNFEGNYFTRMWSTSVSMIGTNVWGGENLLAILSLYESISFLQKT